MVDSELNKLIVESADPKRVSNFLTQLRTTTAIDWLNKANNEELRALVSLFSGSG
jgi:Mg/Co/Ni transporter MgtE